ncbi:hypothetical protein ABH940_006146 [Streptacidiphilus sp. BW17]|jgi:hypothetical protein|uniref:DsbA family protein n=1 Tax=Streptacidiphilus sp. BW17 TaxID=3156274 RepID=UPI003518F3F7
MHPANTTGAGHSVLYYGSLETQHVLQVFLEARDAGSATMAESLLGTIRKAADDGRFVVQFHFAANIDDEFGGRGSRRSLSALGAAADVGAGEFVAFLDALFSCQPACFAHDSLCDPRFLLDVAGRVPGLRSDGFDQKVLKDTYADWAATAAAAFQLCGLWGTPTILFDKRVIWLDKLVVLGVPRDPMLTPRQFLASIRA